MAAMRRIVVYNQLSADGYFAGKDGILDWVVPDAEAHTAAVASLASFDTMLFGRRTYDQFESFWPHAIDESPTAPEPHGAGRRSPEMRAMGMWINDSTKVVFSRTRKDVTWRNSRLVHELDPREVEALKREPGKDIIVFGSGSIVTRLTEQGLIDEYQLVISPVVLGSGRTMLGDLTKSVRLTLLEAKAHASGNVVLRYARP